MEKFGIIKSKLLSLLSEKYANNEKNMIKETLSDIIKDKKFKDLYLFYESIETKYIEDKELAEEYVNEVISILKENKDTIKNIRKKYTTLLEHVDYVKLEIYDILDTLSEEKTLLNVDSILQAKKQLINHLTTRKSNKTHEKDELFTENMSLLYGVLINDFNKNFSDSLTISEKIKLKEYMDIPDNILTEKFDNIVKEINSKLNKMLEENHDSELQDKINKVLNEIETYGVTRSNLYRLYSLNETL